MRDAPAVHRRILELYPAVVAGRGIDEALELIDPDVVDHRGGLDGDHHGRDAWRTKWEGLGSSGFHDLSATVEQNVAAGDTSVNRYTLRGTHTASGRTYEISGLDMIIVRNGRVVEHWALGDWDLMRHQLAGGPPQAGRRSA
jgi:ketosteroid isomerase-like protein